MKIDPSQLTQAGLGADGPAAPGARRPGDPADVPAAGADIQIKRSPTLRDIEQTLAAHEVNTARVEAIKAALARGDYQISPERIASGLIHTSLQTLVEGD
jgi:flagellar biosynthesis anti-sigma factor FlgM